MLDKIGQGGMASVYLAMQESLQRPVAIKILNNPESPGFHERFMNEGRYIAALGHSNIVDVHDVGECDGHYYIIMEYLPNGDLRRRIRQGIVPAQALEYAISLAGCLDYLHEQGLVHRDLKPSNILFRGDGTPVITDFGIAKILQQENELTRSGELMGSPYYLSPEQALSSGGIDGRSDLYSLGVIIYEMLTGQLPFDGEGFVAVVMAHREHPVPILPEELIQYQPIIDQLLAKEPDQRYQTGRELVEEIRALYLDEATVGLGMMQTDDPAVEAMVVRRNSEKLHFDTGVWSSRLLFLVILCLLAGVLFLPQKQKELVQLKTEMDQWLADLAGWHTPNLWQASDERIDNNGLAPGIVEQVDAIPPEQDSEAVESLLELATARLQERKLSFPQGDSALHYFREILKLQPDNPQAKNGIKQVVHWYLVQAQQAMENGNSVLAVRYLSRGRIIDSQHPGLLALSRQLSAVEPPQR